MAMLRRAAVAGDGGTSDRAAGGHPRAWFASQLEGSRTRRGGTRLPQRCRDPDGVDAADSLLHATRRSARIATAGYTPTLHKCRRHARPERSAARRRAARRWRSWSASACPSGRVSRPARRTAPNRGRLDGMNGMTGEDSGPRPARDFASNGQLLQSCTILQRGAQLRTLDELTRSAPRQPRASFHHLAPESRRLDGMNG